MVTLSSRSDYLWQCVDDLSADGDAPFLSLRATQAALACLEKRGFTWPMIAWIDVPDDRPPNGS